MAKSKPMTYSQALSDLEKIVEEIESEEIDVDQLSEKVKKAAQLIKFCRTKLKGTEEEVKKAVAELAEQGERAPARTDEEEEDGF